MVPGGNWLASSSRVLGMNALDLASPYQPGSDRATGLTLSIAASHWWIGSGGGFPKPADFRYASDWPQRVTGVSPPTRVPVIVPSIVLAVTEVSLAVHTPSAP